MTLIIRVSRYTSLRKKRKRRNFEQKAFIQQTKLMSNNKPPPSPGMGLETTVRRPLDGSASTLGGGEGEGRDYYKTY